MASGGVLCCPRVGCLDLHGFNWVPLSPTVTEDTRPICYLNNARGWLDGPVGWASIALPLKWGNSEILWYQSSRACNSNYTYLFTFFWELSCVLCPMIITTSCEAGVPVLYLGNSDSERWGNLLKVTQLVRGKAGTWSHLASFLVQSSQKLTD